MNLLIAILTACQKQPNATLSPKELKREIVAATTYYAVEIVRADGTIDSRERQMIGSRMFRGVDPIAYDQMNREKALKRLSILPENVRRELSALYENIANIDGVFHPEEQFLLSYFDSAKSDVVESEPAMAILALEDRRSEVPNLLYQIQAGLKTKWDADNKYVSATVYPPLSGGKTRLWVDENSGGFKQLTFEKPKEVRGSYWIELIDQSYMAYGVIDADADGEYATFVATPDSTPRSITASEVY